MSGSIILGLDTPADAARVFEILSTTEGQRGFWTADCEVSADAARFGFAEAPVDLVTTVSTDAGKLVRMSVTSGFPFWVGSTWEWELSGPARAQAGTGVLFRHYGFEDGYPETDLAHTAQAWAMIMDRLGKFAATGEPQPFFTAA